MFLDILLFLANFRVFQISAKKIIIIFFKNRFTNKSVEKLQKQHRTVALRADRKGVGPRGDKALQNRFGGPVQFRAEHSDHVIQTREDLQLCVRLFKRSIERSVEFNQFFAVLLCFFNFVKCFRLDLKFRIYN